MKILALATHRYYAMVALYEDTEPIWYEPQDYNMDELDANQETFMAQEDYRFNKLRDIIKQNKTRVGEIDAFACTGGMLKPVAGGAYLVSPAMIEDLHSCKYGYNASNFGAPLLQRLALVASTKNLFVINPPSVDELDEATRMTGFPNMRRRSRFHALNQKAVAYREAARLGKPIEECNFIVLNIAETLSVGTHKGGRVIDANDTGAGNGPMSFSQSGHLPPALLIEACFAGDRSKDELLDLALHNGGMKAHLGIDDFDEIVSRAKAGERRVEFVMESFIKQLAKQIGAAAALLCGKADAIILTGEFVRDEYFADKLRGMVEWIAPIRTYPGEDELQAVAEGALRVLNGTEEAKVYI